MYNISLNDTEITFNGLEEKIYKFVCDSACELMKEVLKVLDRKLLNSRNSKVYRNRGMRKNTIKTIMGNIEYERHIYEYKTAEGKKAYKFLLDEYLQMNTIGKISTNLAEKIFDNIDELSYRKTASNIEKSCNQNISHMAVWNLVQRLGSKIKEKEKRSVKLLENGQITGKKEVDVLFQEQDGIWLYMQRNDRPKNSKSKKRELKLSITYEGWKKRQNGNGYEVINKIACAGFENSRNFKKISDAKIAQIYNIDEIKTRIINGDGAKWIKASIGEEGVYYQLDPFHKSQAILRALENKKEAKYLIKLVTNGKMEESFNYIKKLMIKYNDDEKKFKKIEALYTYFDNNRAGLIPYHLRKDINLPKPPKGVEYRHLGTMEHNICDILAHRMKGRKMSWSIAGANNLAKVLSEKVNKKIYSLIEEFGNQIISEDKLESIEEAVILTAANVNKKPKKSNIYPIRHGKMPFEGSAMSNWMKGLRRYIDGSINL